MRKSLREITTYELIGEEVFLSDDKDETNPCGVFANGKDTEEDPIRIYTIDSNFKVREFKLTKTQSIIEAQHRAEILEYRLCKVTPEDEVTLGDIFMQGNFIEEILV
jgi:hypothetical protein